MTIDRARFFTAVRPLFGGTLQQGQVDGMTAILDAWDAWAPQNADLTPNIRWEAYSLGTAFRETGRTMQPVAEIGQGAGRDYGRPDPVTGLIYYGRGLVQLTWKANYQVQGARLGIDLEHDPELALRPDVAADIMLNGMAHGQFTGRRLGQYFGADPRRDDPVGARRIINSQDQAVAIAGYHHAFLAALTAAGGK